MSDVTFTTESTQVVFSVEVGRLSISVTYDENCSGNPSDYGFSLPEVGLTETDEEELLGFLMGRKRDREDSKLNEVDQVRVKVRKLLEDAGKACSNRHIDETVDAFWITEHYVPTCIEHCLTYLGHRGMWEKFSEWFDKTHPRKETVAHLCMACGGTGNRGFAGRCRNCNGTGRV